MAIRWPLAEKTGFKENEIASIVKFYLLMFKDCKILPKTIHPIKIQFHDEEINTQRNKFKKQYDDTVQDMSSQINKLEV